MGSIALICDIYIPKKATLAKYKELKSFSNFKLFLTDTSQKKANKHASDYFVFTSNPLLDHQTIQVSLMSTKEVSRDKKHIT